MSEIDYSKIEDIAVRAAQEAPMDRMREVAKEAAKEAVIECAALWGFNTARPLEMQKDMAHLTSIRKRDEDISRKLYGYGLKGFALMSVAFVAAEWDKLIAFLR